MAGLQFFAVRGTGPPRGRAIPHEPCRKGHRVAHQLFATDALGPALPRFLSLDIFFERVFSLLRHIGLSSEVGE